MRLLGAASALCSAWAHAQSPQTEALRLFQEGRELSAQERYAEAAAKFEASYRLNGGGGTLLNLALCHERVGRTATAWREFTEAQRLAARDARSDRREFAERHLSELERRLSRLRVMVPPSAADLRVALDAEPLDAVHWGQAIEVDPGDHTITASAPGHVAYRRAVQVGADADFVEVRVPALPRVEPASKGVRQAEPGWGSQRIAAAVIAGVGLGAVGVGAYFGVRAMDDGQASDALCAAPPTRCSAAGVRLGETAQTNADYATAFFVGGAIAIGVATWLWFSETAPKPPPRAVSARVRSAW